MQFALYMLGLVAETSYFTNPTATLVKIFVGLAKVFKNMNVIFWLQNIILRHVS